jgi:hypothetical protein
MITHFKQPQINAYFQSLDVDSGSTFFEVFSAKGVIDQVNESRLADHQGVVGAFIDRLFRSSDINDAEDINLERADRNLDYVNVELCENRLSNIVKPMGLGQFNKVYKDWVGQELSTEQGAQLESLFIPLFCEAFGDVVKAHGIEIINVRKCHLEILEAALVRLQS